MGKVAEHIAIEMSPTRNEEILVLADIISKYSYPTPLDSALFVETIKDELDNLLYNYSYCTETISMTTLPIYYLQPNTRIFVRDDNSGICGEYIVSSFTIPLTYNGSMSISATKAISRVY